MSKSEDSYEKLTEEHEYIGSKIVHACYKLHRDLGPGLYENVYETCLSHLLTKDGINVERQVRIPIEYDGLLFPEGYRVDLWVNELVICELKSVEKIHPLHKVQLLTYMKLSNTRLGYLINFNASMMKYGIRRIIN